MSNCYHLYPPKGIIVNDDGTFFNTKILQVDDNHLGMVAIYEIKCNTKQLIIESLPLILHNKSKDKIILAFIIDYKVTCPIIIYLYIISYCL